MGAKWPMYDLARSSCFPYAELGKDGSSNLENALALRFRGEVAAQVAQRSIKIWPSSLVIYPCGADNQFRESHQTLKSSKCEHSEAEDDGCGLSKGDLAWAPAQIIASQPSQWHATAFEALSNHRVLSVPVYSPLHAPNLSQYRIAHNASTSDGILGT